MKRPNVVVFFTDQQRWDTSSLHGNPMELMPNFERMARKGTHLANHFTCQPVCGPARSCLQTGLYATETGSYRNGIPLSPELTTLADYFNRAGYRTGYIGKWHLGGTQPSWDIETQEPVPAERRGGYQDWLAADMLEFASDAYDTRLYDTENRQVRLPGYRVDALTDAAIRYIDAHKADPFFLFLSFLEPHHQNSRDDYPAPEGYAEKYRGGWIPPDLVHLRGSSAKDLWGYYGMVKRLDECLGRVLDALKSLGLSDDTVVLFTSDHGNHFKTRNGEYKRSCHDSSIRVPTALCGPGFDGGGEIEALTSLVDLPPTILDCVDLEQTTPMSGRSVLPLVSDPTAEWPEEVFVQISESQIGRAVRTHRWKYAVTAVDGDPFADSAREHYIETELYDLYSDPYELENLAGFASHRSVADRMKSRLLERIASVERTKPHIENARVRSDVGQRVIVPGDEDQ